MWILPILIVSLKYIKKYQLKTLIYIYLYKLIICLFQNNLQSTWEENYSWSIFNTFLFSICFILFLVLIFPVKRKYYTCGLCIKSISSKTFKKHMKIHMPKNDKNQELMICEYCKYYFTYESISKHSCNKKSLNIDNEEINTPSTSYATLKNKLENKKLNIEYSKTLTANEINILTSNLNHKIIENKQQSQITPVNLEILKPWQQSILDILTPNNYDNRTIYILYDEIGGIGKTTLKHHVEQFSNFLTISGCATTNLYYAYQKLLSNLNETNWNIIIDLPRTTQYLPAYIEQIKDNIFPSYNYYQTPLKISNPNIFIFLNNLKLLTALSIDRIKLFIVEDNKLILKNIREHKKQIELTTGNTYSKFSHKKIIKQKNEYKCNICNNLFLTSDSLKRHQLNFHYVMSNSKMFCVKCNLYFSCPQTLFTHIFVYHKSKTENNFINSIINSNVTNINNYFNTCHLCKKSCKNLICENCLPKTSYISKNEVQCNYCESMISVEKMHSHLIYYHIQNVIDPLYQFDMCM